MGKEKKKDDWQPYPGDDDHTVHYNPRKDPLHVPKHPDLHNSREERRAARLRAKGLLPDPVEEVKEKKEVKKVEIESFDNDEGEDDDYYDESPKKKKKKRKKKKMIGNHIQETMIIRYIITPVKILFTYQNILIYIILVKKDVRQD